MSIRHMKEKKHINSFLLLLFLCTEQFIETNLFTFSQDRAAHFLNMLNVHLLLHLFASLCHILYFDEAKFSIKLFSLVYFSCFCSQTTDNYE